MHISAITGFYHVNSNLQKTANKYNCSFKSTPTPWEDDEYDSNSIFGIWDRRERRMGADDLRSSFTTFDEPVGSPCQKPFCDFEINSLRYIGNNCYKGGMIEASNYVKELKENGIERIVVLCDLSECNIFKACRDNNMDLTHLFVPLSITNAKSEDDFHNEFSYQKFINVIEYLRKGNVLIGCESGNIRTRRLLHVTQILDPNCKLKLGKSMADVYDYIVANWIYKRLNTLAKQSLNYTQEFENKLRETLAYRAKIL